MSHAFHLLVFSSVLTLHAQAPDRARIEALYERTSAKVLDTAALQALGQTATGCAPHEEGETKNDFRTAVRPAGSTVNPRLQSPVTDANPIPPDERAPRYFLPSQRVSVLGFTYVEQNGTLHTVGDLRGEIGVVFLFKPDCKFTSEMMGEIIRLYRLQAGKAFKIIPVSIGSEGWVGLTRWRQQNMNILPKEFPIFYPGSSSGTGTSLFGELWATPTTIILDRHGRVAWRIPGTVPSALADRLTHIMLEGALESLPPVSPK